METCKLCGNPHKEEKKLCTFCTGDHRRLFGVDLGPMYQGEYNKFTRNAYFYSPVAIPLLRFIQAQQTTSQDGSPSTVAVWGGQRSGKTWLINAFVQSAQLWVHDQLSFSLRKEQPSSIDVIGTTFIKDAVFNPFPITPTETQTEHQFYFFRKKYVMNLLKNEKIAIPGANSHINEIFLFDDKGGRLIDSAKGARIDHLSEGEQDLAQLARHRIASSKYIIILIGKTENTDILFSGLGDLINRIRAEVKGNQSKKIAICLNKVEHLLDFKAHRGNPKKLRDKEFFHDLLRHVFKQKANSIINKFTELEELEPLCTMKYFVISSCGYCDNNIKLNLDPQQNHRAPIELENWHPINIFPVFAWFFDHIEKSRLDCREERFSRFYELPSLLARLLKRFGYQLKNIHDQRMREYISYFPDHEPEE